MARTRATDYDSHRDRILEQAVGAFARIGFPSASMASLARACGTSKAGLYHYFSSKDALLFAALDRHTRRLQSTVRAVRERQLAPREELAELVRALMAVYRDTQAYHAALLHDVKFLPAIERDLIRAQEREVVDSVSDILLRAYPERVLPENQTVVAMALLGMINFTFAWLRPDGPVSHASFAEAAIELWTRGLEGSRLESLQSTQGAQHEQAVRIEG